MQRFPRPSLAVSLLIVAALLLAACDDGRSTEAASGGASPSNVITAVSSTPSPSARVKPPAPPKPPPPTQGPKSKACIDGWTTPLEGDKLRDLPLRVLRNETRWRGDFVVTDMRYFTGPESPPSPDKGYLRVIQRWYVKGYMKTDPALQGRFLVERLRFGSGVTAVAPYDSTGWRSPDWIGFQLDTADSVRRTYPKLPGKWAGIPYDFVKGGAGIGFPGLPAEVTGCLDGT